MNPAITNKIKALTEKAVKAASPIVKKEVKKNVSEGANGIINLLIKVGCAGLIVFTICDGKKVPTSAVSKVTSSMLDSETVRFIYNDIHATFNYMLKEGK